VSRTGFVGREKEVAAGKELLCGKTCGLITVTGPAGIGRNASGSGNGQRTFRAVPGLEYISCRCHR